MAVAGAAVAPPAQPTIPQTTAAIRADAPWDIIVAQPYADNLPRPPRIVACLPALPERCGAATFGRSTKMARAMALIAFLLAFIPVGAWPKDTQFWNLT